MLNVAIVIIGLILLAVAVMGGLISGLLRLLRRMIQAVRR